MRVFVLTWLIAFLPLLGCNTTGGTIGGLMPAPKLLDGKIEDSTYYAKDGSFQIRTPFPQDAYAYKYMAVKEQYQEGGAYVSFNSSVYPDEIYRIEVGRKMDASLVLPPLDKVVDGYVEDYKNQLSGYGGKPGELWRRNTTLNGNAAFIVVLKQFISTKKTFHIIYLVEHSNGFGMISVQWPHPCESCESGPEGKVLTQNKKIKDFVSSIRLTL